MQRLALCSSLHRAPRPHPVGDHFRHKLSKPLPRTRRADCFSKGRAHAMSAAPDVAPGASAPAFDVPAFDASRLSPTALDSLGHFQERFAEVLEVQSGLLSNIAGELELTPLDTSSMKSGGAQHTVSNGFFQASSQDGKSSMCVQAFSGRKLERLTAGWACFAAPVPTGYSRLVAWADATTDAPHFTCELIYYGDAGLLYCQLIPRKDCILDPPYLDKYIAQPAPGCQRSFMALEDECFKQEGWKPFKSLQPLVRYFSSGLAIAFWLPPDGVEAAGSAAREAADMWLAFMRGGAGNEGSQGAQAVAEGEQGALAVRDAALRRAGVWGDAHFTMLGKVFGEEALGVMGELLTGEPRPKH